MAHRVNITKAKIYQWLLQEEEAHMMRLVCVLRDLILSTTVSKDKREELIRFQLSYFVLQIAIVTSI